MLPIQESSRVERLERALMAIEGLTFSESERHLEENPFADKVYQIAHSALAFCKANHNDWLLEIEDIEKELKKANICDIEKYLKKEK